MLTPNRRSCSLGALPSAGLDRPSHLDEILPQKSKQSKSKKVSPTGVAPAISTTLNERLVAATSLHASSDTHKALYFIKT